MLNVLPKLGEKSKRKKRGKMVDFQVDGTVCNSSSPTQISTVNNIARFSRTTTENNHGTYLFQKLVCCLSEIQINWVSCILLAVLH